MTSEASLRGTMFWCVHIIVCVFRTEVSGQLTETNSKTCTYSFVVPQTDLVSTCQAFSRQQVETLQQNLNDLQNKVNILQQRASSTVSPTWPPVSYDKLLNPTFLCECQNASVYQFSIRDCQDVASLTQGISGVYEITPINTTSQLISVKANDSSTKTVYWIAETFEPIKVKCSIEGVIGWTVLMYRSSMEENFNRSWEDYKQGFGDMSSEFWLGLETMHQITTQRYSSYALWNVITEKNHVPHVSAYDNFKIHNEESQYKIYLGQYQGKLTNYFSKAHGKPFLTWDRNSADEPQGYSYGYRYSENCPTSRSATGGGGWWFDSYMYSKTSSGLCGSTNLNARQPYWGSLVDGKVKSVIMKIRPMQI